MLGGRAQYRHDCRTCCHWAARYTARAGEYRRKLMIRYVFVLVVLLLPRLTTGSEIVFSNLGPSYSFGQLAARVITGPDAYLGGIRPGNYDAGVMFTVSPSQNYTLDAIELPLSLYEGADS